MVPTRSPNFDPRQATRAGLLPEEESVGSDDPEAQAAAVLSDSDERFAEQAIAPRSSGERRTSDDATPPSEL
jgi:hypothetical protein